MQQTDDSINSATTSAAGQQQQPIWLRRINSKSSASAEPPDEATHDDEEEEQDEEELDSLTHLAAPRILRRQDSAGYCGHVGMATNSGAAAGQQPRCHRSDSTDSIGPELLTFRPIQAMPLTPPGRPTEAAAAASDEVIRQPRPLPPPGDQRFQFAEGADQVDANSGPQADQREET